MSAPKTAAPARSRTQIQRAINRALLRATGYELRRRPAATVTSGPRRIEVPPAPPTAELSAAMSAEPRAGERLVHQPTFILSSVRSGSTLLRLMLDSHPAICAPFELHLRRIGTTALGHGNLAMRQLGLDERGLRNLLWDRLVHRELVRSGKSHFVNKTPTDALMWADIVACWPDARFVYLHRHPAAIVDSWAKARAALTRDEVARDVLAYAIGMEQARAERGGLVVRYEDLTADPAAQTQRICTYLGLPWDASMIDYQSAAHAGLRRGLGDWSSKLQSGQIHAAGPEPEAERIPLALRGIARQWDYLPAPAPMVTPPLIATPTE